MSYPVTFHDTAKEDILIIVIFIASEQNVCMVTCRKDYENARPHCSKCCCQSVLLLYSCGSFPALSPILSPTETVYYGRLRGSS